jgi:type III pantothenate kinase
MNALLIDAGNSRIKWALVREGRLGPLQAAEVTDGDALAAWLAKAPQFERTLASSVAGADVERSLAAALRSGGAPAAEFMQSSARAAGVSNGYGNPLQLGVDRWVGAVAAWNLAGCYRAICVVSIGTALTIDVVDHDGAHRGGLIAPSPTLMLQSLLRDTAGIAAHAANSPATKRRKAPGRDATLKMLATDTRQAIELGCLSTASALIDRTVTDVTRALRSRPVVFLTGGGADAVAPLIRSACKRRDDLVLRGLAVLGGIPLRRRG